MPDWFIHIENGDLGRLVQLVESRQLTDLNASITTPKWDGGLTVLGRAVLIGNLEMVSYLLKKGADVDRVCAVHEEHKHFSPKNKFTPLGAAISIAHPEIVYALLNEGASIKDPCFNDTWLPLEFAASKLASRVDLVLKHYSPEDQIKKKAEQIKLDQQMMIIIGHLLSFRADVNVTSLAGGHTLLGAAVFKGQLALVQELIKKGANVNAVCFSTTSKSHEYTPLGLAAALKFSDIGEVLIKAGASRDQEFKFAEKMTTPRAMGF